MNYLVRLPKGTMCVQCHKECVAKYKICRTTLYKKCKDGTIPHSRIGARVLISKAAIEAAIKSQSVAI